MRKAKTERSHSRSPARRSPSSPGSPDSPTKGYPMPPSSLARPTSPLLTMRPGQRAAEDEKRVKARTARKNDTPGPGTYSPDRMKGTQEALVGSSAFKSKLDRDKLQPSTSRMTDWGDPGAYEEPKAFLAVASTARASTRSLSKAGKDGFGGTEKRTLMLSNMTTKPPSQGWTGAIEDTPGPAAYEPLVDERGLEHQMRVMNSNDKMKSSAFASGTAQRLKHHVNGNPGAGAYSPEYNAVEPSIGNLVSKTGRDHHFVADNLDGTGDDSTTQAHVGPGSYNSHAHKTIQYEQDLKVWELPNASFMSDSFRTIYTGQQDEA